MSVVGIDIGTLNTIVAVARNRGIDVITNEVSNRATPTLVSFGSKQRYLGEAAKTQETSNFKNTVSDLKRLVGRPIDDPDIDIERKYINANVIGIESCNEVGVSVNFLDEQQEFSYTQLLGMFLGKVKDFTSKEINIPLTDAVISVPGWFSTHQRQAVLDAAAISGINPLSLINELTASALGYGITKTDLPDPANNEKPRNVVFVDFGYSSYQVAVVSFIKGKLIVKSTAYDRNLGGRNFDDAILEHYIKEFDSKYKLDIKSSKKAIFRLRTGIEKAKKILSANSVTMLNVECLMDDKDVSAQVKREDFEEWCQPLVNRLEGPMKEAIERSGIALEDIHSVELIGGTTRIPMVRQKLAEVFGDNKLATTLNQDEAVARGCAFQCAIISPVLKVREFSAKESNGYPIEVSWDPSVVPPSNDGKEVSNKIEAFNVGTNIPCTRNLTLTRVLNDEELKQNNGSVDIDLSIDYSSLAVERGLPATGNNIGKYKISNIKKVYPEDQIPEGGEIKATIKVRITANESNIVYVESASQLAELIITEKVKVEKSTDNKDEKEKSKTEQEEEEPEYTVSTKKVIREFPLNIQRIDNDERNKTILSYYESEGKMFIADKLAIDTAEKRNSLEEYVYDARDKLDTVWSEYVDESTKQEFKKSLSAMEDWLYTEEGEDATRDKYHNQLLSLKKIGDPIAKKLFDYEESIRLAREKEIAEAKAKLEAEEKAKLEAEAKLNENENINEKSDLKNSNEINGAKAEDAMDLD